MRRDLLKPTIGAVAPPIDAIDADGRRWRLADQRGRIQVLIFHRHIH